MNFLKLKVIKDSRSISHISVCIMGHIFRKLTVQFMYNHGCIVHI